MLFHRSRIKTNTFNATVYINDIIIQEVNSIKCLGLINDNKFKWINHIAHVESKISRGVVLSGKRFHISTINLVYLYYSLISPYSLYCVEVGEMQLIHIHNPYPNCHYLDNTYLTLQSHCLSHLHNSRDFTIAHSHYITHGYHYVYISSRLTTRSHPRNVCSK